MPTADAIAAASGGNLSPATPFLLRAAAGRNLAPTDPGQTTGEREAVAASGILYDGSDLDFGDVVEIGGMTYERVNSAPLEPGQFSGANDGVVPELIDAINGADGVNAPHQMITAAGGVADTMALTAKIPGSAGNSISTTTSLGGSATTTWGTATLTGGSDAYPVSGTPGAAAAVAGGNLAPTAPFLATAAASGNLTPTAPFLATAAAGGNLSPTAPGLTQAAAGGNLSPTAPGGIA